MTTVVDQFAETLAASDVSRIYTIVGDSLNGLTDAIHRKGSAFTESERHTHGLEGNATFSLRQT